MGKGLRFFGTDYNEASFDNEVTVSSADAKKDFMFDGIKATKWISDGSGTEGNAVSVIVDFETTRILDSFYIENTNIEDIELQYYDGADWTTLSGAVATVTKSADLANVFVKTASQISATQVKIVGTNTIVEDQEKSIVLFHAFLELGQLEYFPKFSPKRFKFQSKFKTTDGRNITIDRGESFEAVLEFKSHVNQNDIDLIEELVERKEPFFIWPCGGDVSIFTYSFYPYRFKDFFKVSIQDSDSPMFTKNYYKSGYNNKIKMVEAA